jgi:nucleoside-diphosphate-sugar epimerase
LRILVTGAGGFIGGRLVRLLAGRGHEIVALYRRAPGDTADRTTWVRADLAESVDHLPAAEAIVHAAAHTHLIPNSTVHDYVRANVRGTGALMRYARRAGVRYVVHLSTISVYGDAPDGELTERTPFANPGAYGTSKYLAELLLREHAAAVPSLSVRLPGVVAPGYLTPWVGRVLKSAMRGEEITIYNRGAPFNNIVDTDELARFIEHVLSTAPPGAETVNLAAAEPSTVGDVVRTIIELAGSRSNVRDAGARKGSFWIGLDKMNRVTGFSPSPTREILTRYVKGTLAGEGR